MPLDRKTLLDAVKEAKIKIGLKFIEKHEIKYNGTILAVGEIIEVNLPENVVAQDGYIDVEKAGTIAISGLDGYHETIRIARLPYAKPGADLIDI